VILILPIIPLLLCASPQLPDGGTDTPEAVTVDGGEVPIAVPKLTEPLAKVLAPELVADGGVQTDGGQAPILANASLSVYQVDLPAETVITAGSFGLYAMVDLLVKPTLQGDVSCRTPTSTTRCNPADLSSFDRYAVGRSSKEWQSFGDIALVTSLVLPTIYLGLESLVLPTRSPWGDWAKDLLVVTESMALAAALDTVLKFSFRRPRPSRYLSENQSTSFDAELSLPSGHTTLVSAATIALATTVFFRHPDSKVRYVVLGAGILLSGLTAFSRVEAGAHFPTDVITGLFVGGASGFIVPYLHRKGSPVIPSVAFNPATGATMFSLGGAL
jgi:membrane-associated phospholipid phosphatase